MRNRYQTSTGHSLIGGLRLVLGAFALAMAFGAQAYVTVGPNGSFATIQAGVNQAILNGGDEVRVQLKCFVGCPYAERVTFDTYDSIQLSGGWDSTFQSQISTLGSPVIGDGSDAPIIQVVARGSAIISVNRFTLDGSGNTAGFYTRGLLVGALDSSSVVISGNTFYGNQVKTSTSALPVGVGGGGVAAQATGSAYISLAGNFIQNNQSIGTDSADTGAGGAYLNTVSSGRIDFVLNTLTNNRSSNANSGNCRGGGLRAAPQDTSIMLLRNNNYTGNYQIFCSTSSSGDAADIEALGSSYVAVDDENWTSNNLGGGSNSGVYEVYMVARSASQILAANGLITNGTWGGLYAFSEGTATTTVSNYTIADNPQLALRGYGPGTQIWNTLLWNNGASLALDAGASFLYGLYTVDPLFIDSANGNYRLSAGSPAINAGYNSPTGGLRAFDLDHLSRPFGSYADVGAYEWHPDPNDLIFANGFD